LLRNNGRGGFDEVSGTAGLDIDQDGRSFAVFDSDADGDADVILMAPRSSPQLRLFRNDFAAGHASLEVRLAGTKSNRDAVGARVTVETDQCRATRIVTAGSGFISQHSKQLLFGLGKSQRIVKVTIAWPSGLVQTLSGVPLNQRVSVQEGNDVFRAEPFRPASTAPGAGPSTTLRAGPSTSLRAGPSTPAVIATAATSGREAPPAETWLYEPFPAPGFTLRDLDGREHSLSGLAGRPVVIQLWATWAPPSRARRSSPWLWMRQRMWRRSDRRPRDWG
jgi:hypothetical protein